MSIWVAKQQKNSMLMDFSLDSRILKKSKHWSYVRFGEQAFRNFQNLGATWSFGEQQQHFFKIEEKCFYG